MKVFERIRQYIDENGIKISAIAERVQGAGIGEQKLYTLLRGTAALKTDDYEVICIHGLHLHPQYFFADQYLETKYSQCVAQLRRTQS